MISLPLFIAIAGLAVSTGAFVYVIVDSFGDAFGKRRTAALAAIATALIFLGVLSAIAANNEYWRQRNLTRLGTQIVSALAARDMSAEEIFIRFLGEDPAAVNTALVRAQSHGVVSIDQHFFLTSGGAQHLVRIYGVPR